MTADDDVRLDAVGLASLIRSRAISPAEAFEAASARYDAVNPAINAVVYDRRDAARAELARVDADAPLAGVPFLVKDLGPRLAGAPLTSGSRRMRAHVPSVDDELFARYKRAGLIIIGKTNTPEFGIFPYTEPHLFGACRNPWNLDRTPGGSSGGSAAAVAAGITTAAHGNDAGGSLRIPASACGLVGFKPSAGIVPVTMTLPRVGPTDVDHAIARSVRDSATLLDIAAATGDARYASAATRDPRTLRIALVRGAMFGTTIHADVARVREAAAATLESLGHRVEPAEPQIDYARLARAYLTLFAVRIATIAADRTAVRTPPRADDFEPPTRLLASLTHAIPATDVACALATIAQANDTMTQFTQTYDVILTPTVAAPPVRIGELASSPSELAFAEIALALRIAPLARAILAQVAAKSFAWAAFTPLFSVTGMPAVSLPLAWTDDDLPIGIQLAAARESDALLLSLAAQIERAYPWLHRRPALNARDDGVPPRQPLP